MTTILVLALAACSAASGGTGATGGSSSGSGTSGGLEPASCSIGGFDYPSGTANPASACLKCDPMVDAGAWTPVCPPHQVCSGGSCVSPESSGCVIPDAGDYSAGAADPADACLVCDPTVDAGAWSPIVCPANHVCSNGSCVSPESSGCVIPDAGDYSADAGNPSNPCQSCDLAVSSTAWTNAPDGTGCGAGKLCTQGVCQAGCYVNGAFVAPDSLEAGNACESCQPASSISAWTPFTGLAPDGGCGTGQLCDNGSCAPGCWLDGGFVSSGALETGNPCEACVPPSSIIAWTALTGLPPDAGCAPDQVCNGGACETGCFIDGGFIQPGAADSQHNCRTCAPATSVRVWVNGFTPFTAKGSAPEIVVVADVNGDTLPDLVVANDEATPLINLGNGKFGPDLPVPMAGAPNAGVVVPSTSGGYPDLYFSSGTNSVDYAIGATSPFTSCLASGYPVACTLGLGAANADSMAVAAGDFDGSGEPGLAVAELAGLNGLAVSYFSNAGLAADTYSTFSLGVPAAQALTMASGDFNGDGLDDLVVAYADQQNETVQLWLAIPDGGFADAGAAFTGPGAGGQLAVADFNRDGNFDLALATGGSQVAVVLGDGTGTFSTPASYAVGSGSNTLVAGDFNADGWPDLAVANAADQTIAVLYNQGDGTFSPPLVVHTCPGIPNSLSASDWVAPNAGLGYGSPTSVLAATDDAGTILGLVNNCQ